jgi:hypothetical protein
MVGVDEVEEAVKVRGWQVGMVLMGLVVGGGMLWMSFLRLTGSIVLPEEVKVERASLPEGVVLPDDPRYVARAMGDWVWWRSVRGGTEERVKRLLALADRRLKVAEVLIRASDEDEVGVRVLEKAEGYLDKAVEEGEMMGGVVEGEVESTVATHEAVLEWAEGEVDESLKPRVIKLKEECGK